MEATTTTTPDVKTGFLWRDCPESSNLRGYGYDPSREALLIEFKNWSLFEYTGVPATIFALLHSSESKGSTYARWIKASYPAKRIERVMAACGDCGAQGPAGVLCADCGCDIYRTDDTPRSLREFFRPTRVLVNSEGEAVAPGRTGVKAEVIFVRDDGWSLGAPRALAAVAREMWEGRWVQVWARTDGNQWECRWPLTA